MKKSRGAPGDIRWRREAAGARVGVSPGKIRPSLGCLFTERLGTLFSGGIGARTLPVQFIAIVLIIVVALTRRRNPDFLIDK